MRSKSYSFLYVAVSGIALLSACSSDQKSNPVPGPTSSLAVQSNSVDSNGNCTSTFVSDYKAMLTERRKIRHEQSGLNELQSFQNACTKFYATHPASISCKAEVDNRVRKIYAIDFKPSCDATGKALSAGVGLTPVPVSVPVAVPVAVEVPVRSQPSVRVAHLVEQIHDNALLEQFSENRMKIRALDIEKIRKLIAHRDQVAVGGDAAPIVEFRNNVASGAMVCSVDSYDVQKALHFLEANKDKEISVTHKNEQGQHNVKSGALRRQCTFSVEDGLLATVCTRLGSEPIQVKEVRQALKGIIEVIVK